MKKFLERIKERWLLKKSLRENMKNLHFWSKMFYKNEDELDKCTDEYKKTSLLNYREFALNMMYEHINNVVALYNKLKGVQ